MPEPVPTPNAPAAAGPYSPAVRAGDWIVLRRSDRHRPTVQRAGERRHRSRGATSAHQRDGRARGRRMRLGTCAPRSRCSLRPRARSPCRRSTRSTRRRSASIGRLAARSAWRGSRWARRSRSKHGRMFRSGRTIFNKGKRRAMSDTDREVAKTDDEWRKELSPSSTRCCGSKGTERAFTGKYWDCHDDGMYRCAACGAELFDAGTKFESGTGWPSFTEPVVAEAVEVKRDRVARHDPRRGRVPSLRRPPRPRVRRRTGHRTGSATASTRSHSISNPPQTEPERQSTWVLSNESFRGAVRHPRRVHETGRRQGDRRLRLPGA